MSDNYNYGEDIPYEEIPEIQDPDIKRKIWDTAIGLQKVDNLTPSDNLLELAEKNIRNEISYQELDDKIRKYYNSADEKTIKEHLEADKVSSRIAQLLESGKTTSFELKKSTLAGIHGSLFEGVFSNELIIGRFRKVNISKAEAVLNGDTVKYSDFKLIPTELDMTLTDEAYNFSPKHAGLTPDNVTAEGIKHIAEFTTNIWKIHPFREGNTRTTAVFIQLYLQSMGFSINNEPFKNNSLYFRNALVRNSYSNDILKIQAEALFLERFFENLLCGKDNVLNNKDLYIDNKSLVSPDETPEPTDSTENCDI